ncbi:hypothetical protein [Kitasatospora sp. NPDC047058]|uniref:hypothetical protein n=1 Tax=Kitasatospora sp. NPDC047058 TaxID=3155620 RepID=UPI00341111E0
MPAHGEPPEPHDEPHDTADPQPAAAATDAGVRAATAPPPLSLSELNALRAKLRAKYH